MLKRGDVMTFRAWRNCVLIGGVIGVGLVPTAAAQAVEPDGATPLHTAVRRDDVPAAKRLISAGADVKSATRYGVTPLGLAAMNGNVTMLRMLLDAGADPNTATPSG